MMNFDKHYKAILRVGGSTKGKARSELTLCRFSDGWKIVGEAGRAVYWTRKQP